MKSQNDMIVAISAGVLALIGVAAFAFTPPEVIKPADPTPVPTAPAQFTPGAVVMGKALPGASSSAGGSAPAGAAPGSVQRSGGTNLASMKRGTAGGGGGGSSEPGAPQKGNPSKAH